jgi:hypothetical protein
VLQRNRHDQVAASGHDAGALRTAQSLAAAERNQVRAGVDEAAQVGGRWQLRGRVDDQRDTSTAAHRGNFLDRRRAFWIGKVRDSHRAIRDRASGGLQVIEWYAGAGCICHGRHGGRMHARTAYARGRAGSIDDGLESELLIHGHSELPGHGTSGLGSGEVKPFEFGIFTCGSDVAFSSSFSSMIWF